MNKLSPEHLHLLLDEPIYVLHNDRLSESIEDDEQTDELVPETNELPDFRGDNKKGILILIEELPEESVAAKDEEFLFKGLNALKVFAEDVAIVDTQPALEVPEIKHKKRIIFSAKPAEENLYQIETIDNISQLSCHSISQIRNDQDLKVQFWLGLKAIFEA